ncbi:MAG: M20/M25/M40 family metallo-hydrolase [Chloroflexi bacterium AL-W]|nr:M20/M25/M40 family metallo-hydrolase [Chloroflexi bacterium AL-N1]NOK66172.1 M20/M25/M40 family metallo-hydrolase [Chloroflexi bacterium AL-N10]NOK73053.1 M20/M25/M40 family metallo-hydrolase [Chloroflexi bacterium AL-N5]NOK79950.1 M20/M25/M40 family metallo-hydrolase [Chloroflexi bacterium AL-W]NOK88194.1 M20/M25/M40 family metallo-hydrolase [Chloroflexi bacterium AL-N15]
MTEPATIVTEHLLDDLSRLCALPGRAEYNDELTVVATRIATMMGQHGLRTHLIPTSGSPVVLGWCPGRSPYTLLLYHHYDVAPTGPWRAWHHDPFQLAERDQVLYGRGVADGKGPLLAHVSALSAILDAEGELPCGVVVLVEGEGLQGSSSLASALSQFPDDLRVDACLATGGERDAIGMPLCYTGVKGWLNMQLTAVGANQTLPPGFATSVSNPLWRVIWALSHIKNENEEILVDGFYDSIESPDRTIGKAIRKIHLDEKGRLGSWGTGEFLFAMQGTALTSAEATLPTCNVSRLVVEPTNDFAAIPMVATARVDFQLVPGQKPQVVVDLVHKHLKNKGITDITIEWLGKYPTASTPFDHVFVKQVCDIGQHLYGMSLKWLPLGPFAQPLCFFQETFDAPIAVIGCARPDSAIYGPNEHIPLNDLVRHGQLLMELLYSCAKNEV